MGLQTTEFVTKEELNDGWKLVKYLRRVFGGSTSDATIYSLEQNEPDG